MEETPVHDLATTNSEPVASAPQLQPGECLGPSSWIPYVLPFIVYMLVGMLEPTPPKDPLLTAGIEHEPTLQDFLGIRYEQYPVIYSAKIGLTILCMLIMLPAYWKFPFRVSGLAIIVGVVGVVLWIILSLPWFNENIMGPLGLVSVTELGERPAYNPLKELAAQPAWSYTFLCIRFLGLALIVPIIEEFFLRGFVLRYIMHPDWWNIPFGRVNMLAILAGTGIPMLMHPAELLAAAVWFSLITWLMIRTKNIWDCVAAHAVTNLLLGIYIVTFDKWYLW